jgi:hypothetical protein
MQEKIKYRIIVEERLQSEVKYKVNPGQIMTEKLTTAVDWG